jgi:hypothetical protein
VGLGHQSRWVCDHCDGRVLRGDEVYRLPRRPWKTKHDPVVHLRGWEEHKAQTEPIIWAVRRLRKWRLIRTVRAPARADLTIRDGTKDRRMSDTGSPPAVDESAYGGRLWPDAAAHAEKSTSEGPGSKNGAPTPASRPRRRVLRVAVAAVVTAGAFAAGSGLGVAIGRTSNEPSTLEEAQRHSYEQGRSDGFAAGVKAGHAKGYSEGYDKGRSASQKAARKDGYSDGYRAGNAAGQESGYADGRRDGYHAGLIQGCEAVFDELNTDRVIDRVPGPYERYWYLKRTQCRYASTW